MASFAEALKKRLKPELYAQVMDDLGDDFDLDLVPRTRLNTVIKQRNELRDKLGDTSAVTDDFTLGAPAPAAQPATPSTSVVQPSGAGTDVAELELKHKADIRELSLKFAVLNKLSAAGAVDPELIYNAKLLDLTKVKDGQASGTFEGLDEVISELVGNKERAYLFNTSGSIPAGTGRVGGSSEPPVVAKEDFQAMDYMARLKLKNEQPAVFEKLKG